MSETANSAQTLITEQVAVLPPGVDMPLLEEMAKAGVIYGRKKSKTNPKMADFIFANRNGFEFFDLLKTLEGLEGAKTLLKEIQEKKGLVLLVSTQPAARGLIEGLAAKTGYPFVVERWLGGTLTNFQTISKRLNYFIKLKNDRASGKLEKYTKKERLMFDREIKRLETLMGGLEKMDHLPDAIFMVDAAIHDTAVREAKRTKIPIIGILNTDNDPDNIQYSIPANTNSRQSVEWVVGRLFN